MADRPIDAKIKGIWWWKKFKVKPGFPHTLPKDRDSFVWTIRESFTTATLFFPNAKVIFDPPAPEAENFPASGTIRRQIADKAPQGTYTYTILAEIDGENWQAEADSPPEIIID